MRHEIIATADSRHTPTLYVRATMHGDMFAEHIEIADLRSRRLATIAEVLRITAQHSSRANLVALSQSQGADQVHVRSDNTAIADGDSAINNRIGANSNVVANLGFAGDDGSRMNLCRRSYGHGCP